MYLQTIRGHCEGLQLVTETFCFPCNKQFVNPSNINALEKQEFTSVLCGKFVPVPIVYVCKMQYRQPYVVQLRVDSPLNI